MSEVRMSVETLTPPVELLEEVQVPAERAELKIAERCDLCGAQAYVAVQFESKETAIEYPGELLFCGHHFAKWADKLHEFVVRDDRERLTRRIVSSY